MTTLTEAKKRQSNLPPLREVPTGLGKRNHWPKSGPTSSFVKQLHLIRESYFQVTNCSFVDRIGCDENAHWLSSQQGPLTSSPPDNRNPIRHLGVKNQSYPVDFCLSEWECLPFWLPWLGRWLAGWLAGMFSASAVAKTSARARFIACFDVGFLPPPPPPLRSPSPTTCGGRARRRALQCHKVEPNKTAWARLSSGDIQVSTALQSREMEHDWRCDVFELSYLEER